MACLARIVRCLVGRGLVGRENLVVYGTDEGWGNVYYCARERQGKKGVSNAREKIFSNLDRGAYLFAFYFRLCYIVGMRVSTGILCHRRRVKLNKDSVGEAVFS